MVFLNEKASIDPQEEGSSPSAVVSTKTEKLFSTITIVKRAASASTCDSESEEDSLSLFLLIRSQPCVRPFSEELAEVSRVTSTRAGIAQNEYERDGLPQCPKVRGRTQEQNLQSRIHFHEVR